MSDEDVRCVSDAFEGDQDDPTYCHVERWSDGSMFITGQDGSVAFAFLGRDNQEDAEEWLTRCTRLLRLVREDRDG